MTAWTVDNSFEADSRISKKVAYLINVICHGHMGEEWQHVCYFTLGAIEQWWNGMQHKAGMLWFGMGIRARKHAEHKALWREQEK